MARSARRTRWLPAPLKAAIGLALGWALRAWMEGPQAWHLQFPAYRWLQEHASPLDQAWYVAGHVGLIAFTAMLAGATMVMPLGYLARTVARARLRSGQPDTLDRVRAWMAAYPRSTAGLKAAPALAWVGVALSFARELRWGPFTDQPAALCIVAMAVAAAAHGLTRAGTASLLAPTLGQTPSPEEPGPSAEKDIFLRAVAVTRETRAAIAGVAATSAIVAAVLLALPWQAIGSLPIEIGLLSYLALVLGGATVFQRASRIAVGVDGVFVTGTSRTRLVAYRDLDDARAAGGNVELLHGGAVVLRLQLHGEDASKQDAVLSKIREAIERARRGASAVAGQLVASATAERLQRLARGDGGEYRRPALTREQLWEIVEAPEVDTSARTAAAGALVMTDERGARARLRVAAEKIADPAVRVALRELAETDDEMSKEAQRGQSVSPRR